MLSLWGVGVQIGIAAGAWNQIDTLYYRHVVCGGERSVSCYVIYLEYACLLPGAGQGCRDACELPMEVQEHGLSGLLDINMI